MEIIVGEKSGFCQGVAFTISKANEYLEMANVNNEKLYCLGKIVHNERIIEDLKNKGLIFVDDISEVPSNSKVIFRAHGERKEIYDLSKEKNLEILDLTCGKVRAVKQKVISSSDEAIILILGKKDHPETIGTYSFCQNGFIVEDEEDLQNIKGKIKSINKNIILVVEQTTFNEELFHKLSSKIKELFIDYDVQVENTICSATHERQQETYELSKNADCMIIIGGKNSSNTKELYNVSKENCENTFLIQNFLDLKNMNIDFTTFKLIGIMAGASTPKISVEEVIEYLKESNKI